MTLIGSNITKYEAQTVQAAFAPGGQPQITANWTGVSLWNILQAGGIPTGASNVTVTGIDGYTQQFTLSQVQSIGMLIGYQENGQYLTPSMGQPYRLCSAIGRLQMGTDTGSVGLPKSPCLKGGEKMKKTSKIALAILIVLVAAAVPLYFYTRPASVPQGTLQITGQSKQPNEHHFKPTSNVHAADPAGHFDLKQSSLQVTASSTTQASCLAHCCKKLEFQQTPLQFTFKPQTATEQPFQCRTQ